MDDTEYSPGVISRYRKKKLFFGDAVLEKHYKSGDIAKFRARAHRVHKDKSFKDFASVIVTDAIRYEIYSIIDELTEFLDPAGDLILSGGDAVNTYLEPKERVITQDIDTKFVPKMKPNEKFFGKLQAVKLLLWNKLGEIAKRVNLKLTKIVNDKRGKEGRFIGFGFAQNGPYVTRRYTLIPKRKFNSSKMMDVLADIELFTLDMKARLYSPKTNKIEEVTMGGILDIAFMRPNEFGFDVGDSKVQALDIFKITGKYVIGKFDNIKLASKKFLIEDSYTMQALGLRGPDKREKDRRRMIKLARLVTKKKILMTDDMKTIMRKVGIPLTKRAKPAKKFRHIPVKKALTVNPRNYTEYTTKPDESKLSKQIVHGIKSQQKNQNIPGYIKTHGNMRFNPHSLEWTNEPSTSYVKNEFTHRPLKSVPIPEKVKLEETLYGFRKQRDSWVPRQILRKSATIPYVGLV